MSEMIKIKTISPFKAPVNVALGVDQSCEEYKSLLNQFVEQCARCLPVHKNREEKEYDTIEDDARDNRILVWRSAELPELTIHLFPNAVAIAEFDLHCDATHSVKQLAKDSLTSTKKMIAKAYHDFANDLLAFRPIDKKKTLIYDQVETEPTVYWVSRFLVLNKNELTQKAKQDLLRKWLKDTKEPQDATAMINGQRDYSMTWLHYAIVEQEQEQAQEDSRISAMVLAQYYYTAQENCNMLLKQAIDSAYNNADRAVTEKKLSHARVVTRLHQIDLHEHKKFLNRHKRKLLDEILDCWDFEEVSENGRRMIEVCSARLEEADNKRRERSTVMTDLLLVTLSFFAVFELSLYLTEFSREMMSRPALDYNDENRSFFLQFIADIDADVMFALGFGLTFALIVVYKVMKGSRDVKSTFSMLRYIV